MVIIVNETQNDFFIIKESKANEDRLYLMTRLPKEDEKIGNKHLGYLNNNRVGSFWSIRTGHCEKMFAETGYLKVPKKKTTKVCIMSHDHTTFYKGSHISVVEGKFDTPEHGGQTQVIILTDKTVDGVLSSEKISRIDTNINMASGANPLSEEVRRYEGPNGVEATFFTFKSRSFVELNDTDTYIWVSSSKKLKVGTVTIPVKDASGDKITINALIRCHPDGSFMMEDKKREPNKPKRKVQDKKPFHKTVNKKQNSSKNVKNAGQADTRSAGKSMGHKESQRNKPATKKNEAHDTNNEKQRAATEGSRPSSQHPKKRPNNNNKSKSLSKLERNKNKYR